MAIQVTCPGCLKRFEVSDKFAGMKGPCPSCRTIIDIPKAQVTVHAPDEFSSGGKTVKGRAILKPLDRQKITLGLREAGMAILVFAIMLGLALLLGKYATSIGKWWLNLIGVAGMTMTSFGTSVLGYLLLRSGDELEFYDGEELYKRAGICALVYTISWILFEFFANFMSLHGTVFVWIYLIPFAVAGIIAAYSLFDLEYSVALIHYVFFLILVLLFRWAIGFGWIWMAANALLTPTGEGNVIRPPAP